MVHDIHNTGAYYLARSLELHGVKQVFGLCGDHINSLYRALDLQGIEIIGTRTEPGAVQMADAYARTSGKLGVAVVTGCPGHSNALTGLSIAHNAQSPVLVISGLTPVDQRYRGGSQVLQQGDLARPISKWALEVPSAAHIPEIVTKAIQIATLGVPGPVSLSVPSDLLDLPVATGKDDPRNHIRAVATRDPIPSEISLSGQHIELVHQLLAASHRPVIILGNGARHDAARGELGPIVERLGIPVFTIDQARGLIPDDGRICFGYADPLFCRTFRSIKGADLIILAGASLDFHQCFGRSQLLDDHVRILQISTDAFTLSQCRHSDIAIHAAPVQVLRQVSRALGGKKAGWGDWLASMRSAYQDSAARWSLQVEQVADGQSIHPLELCASLQRHRKADTGIVIDVGDYVHWPRAYFPALSPGRWMDAVLIGNLGGAIPLGIGSLVANPQGEMWVFIGDGGFGFCSWDLEVAVERKLPLKIILGNDAGWGVEKRLQSKAYGKHVGCELRDVRYDKFADLIGAKGFFVEQRRELDAVVDAFVQAEGPALLNVKIRQEAGRPLIDFPRY
jgi:acetolactate synthase-1/2/3 large subunit